MAHRLDAKLFQPGVELGRTFHSRFKEPNLLDVVKTGEVSLTECEAFLQKQRQVCMFTSTAQVARIIELGEGRMKVSV